jgi:hypothetical protein
MFPSNIFSGIETLVKKVLSKVSFSAGCLLVRSALSVKISTCLITQVRYKQSVTLCYENNIFHLLRDTVVPGRITT